MVLQRVDATVLGWFERFAHRFQRWTGKTNFWLAKACWLCFVFDGLPAAFVPRHEVDVQLRPMRFIIFAFMLLLSFRLFHNLNKVEAYYAEGKGTGHPLTLLMRGMWPVRVGLAGFMTALTLPLLTAFLFGHGNWQAAVFLIGWWMQIPCFYFLAVVPLPPGKSKVREFLESLFHVPQTAQADGTA